VHTDREDSWKGRSRRSPWFEPDDRRSDGGSGAEMNTFQSLSEGIAVTFVDAFERCCLIDFGLAILCVTRRFCPNIAGKEPVRLF
jgi:hypothetical protein